MKALACCLCLLWSLFSVASDIDNAVILLYHHVSTETPASTSISPTRFREHMAYLAEHHHVMDLPDVIKSLQQGKPLPDKTVVITFDDGYENILTNGHPILKAYGFPYTIFINPALIGTQSYQLSWPQVKQMAKDGVTFANHTQTHNHLLARQNGESEKAWLKRTWEDIQSAEQQLQQQLGYSLKHLAYPYGEFNRALQQKLTKNGYVSFGQHSGAIASYSDFSALPRYPAAGPYANLDSLKTKLNSLAMPITDLEGDNELTHAQRFASLRLTLAADDLRLGRLNCFFNNQALPLAKQQQRVELQVVDLPVGRSRVNCTAPSESRAGRFYWYSHPWFRPTADGKWPD